MCSQRHFLVVQSDVLHDWRPVFSPSGMNARTIQCHRRETVPAHNEPWMSNSSPPCPAHKGSMYGVHSGETPIVVAGQCLEEALGGGGVFERIRPHPR